MILTTTPSIEGQTVSEYLGIVTGEAIIGANVLKDIMAAITDITGGRAGQYESALKRAREEALREMSHEARSRGANGIIGIDIDYEVLGARNGMLMVSAAGTAVVLDAR